MQHLEGSRVPEAIVRIEREAGEEAQVDFGTAGEQIDPETGEVRKAWVFVMTLSFSRHQYATLVFDQPAHAGAANGDALGPDRAAAQAARRVVALADALARELLGAASRIRSHDDEIEF